MLPQTRIKNIRDLADCIDTSLDGRLNESKATTNDILLAATYVAGYISAEELICLLGIEDRSTQVRKALSRLVSSGLLNEFPLTKQDGITRKLYYLSPDGFEYTLRYFIYPWNDEFKRRKRGLAPLHDYSTGMNLLALTVYKKPFWIGKEVGLALSKSGLRPLSGSLRIDATACFNDSHNMRLLYIEQDMNTETISTLVEKIANYCAKQLLNSPKDSCLIFSFRDSTVPVPRVDSAIKKLIQRMKATETRSLYDAFNTEIFDRDYIQRVFEELECIEDNQLIKDLDIDDLIEYSAQITDTYSDNKYETICNANLALSTKKHRNMTNLIMSQYESREYMSAFLRGYSVYTLATPLITNYLPYIMPERLGAITPLEGYLRHIDSNIRYQSILSDTLYSDKGLPLTLRNIFTGTNMNYALEYVSRDLGAIYRCRFFRENMLKISTGYTVLMLVDSLNDALFIADTINYCELEEDNKSEMFFMLRDEKEPKPFLFNKERQRLNYRL